MYYVTGKNQKSPSNWQQALKSSNFKFLSSDWQISVHATVLHDHIVYIVFEDKCIYISELNGQVVNEQKQQYICQHKEADTRLIYHMKVCVEEHVNNRLRESISINRMSV